MGRIVVTQPPLSDNAALHYARSIAAGARAGDGVSQSSGDVPASGVFIARAADGGSDSNTGGILDPYLTFAAAQAAVGAGEGIFYRGGTYTDPTQFIAYDKSIDGAGGERITVRSYDGGGAAIFDNLGRNSALAAVSGSGAIVELFEFKNSGDGTTNSGGGLGLPGTVGILLSGSYNTFRRNWIHDITGNGQSNLGSMRIPEVATHVTVHNCGFEKLYHPVPPVASKANVTHIIQFSNDPPASFNTHNTTIHSCYFAIDAPDGQVMVRHKHSKENAGNRLYNCTFHNLGTSMACYGMDIVGDVTQRAWTVDHCLFIHCGIAHDFGGGLATWEYLTLYGARSLFRAVSWPTIVRRNIFYVTGAYGGDGERTWRYNWNQDDAGYADAIANDIWENNVYHRAVGGNHDGGYFGSSSGGPAGGTYTLAQFQALGQDIGSIQQDPQFGNPAALDFTVGNANAQGMGCYQAGYDPPLSVAAALGW